MTIVGTTSTTTETETGTGLATEMPATEALIDLRDHRSPAAPAPVDPATTTPEDTTAPDADADLDTDRDVESPAVTRTPLRSTLRVGRRLATGTAWLVVIIGALVLLVPALLGLDRYVIVGSSMSGAFEKGSVVFAEQVPVTDLVVGDVITYEPPPGSGVTQLITHRIVAIETDDAGGPLFRTRGDANEADDPWTFSLPGEQQNRVVASVPHLGSVLTHLSDPANRLVVIGIPAAAIALVALVELVRAVRPHRDADRDEPAGASS